MKTNNITTNGSISLAGTTSTITVSDASRYSYVCERHGEIGRDSGLQVGAPTITSTLRGHEGEVRCLICYWENVIVPNCGKVTNEPIK